MEIFNNQKKIKIQKSKLLDFTKKVLELCPQADGKTLAIAFISDKKMLELNKQFRGKDHTTDVLSFPFGENEFEKSADYLGDIAISAEQALKQSKENNINLETELKQLILHGVLHLCGFDHETDNGEMNELELKLRGKLGIS